LRGDTPRHWRRSFLVEHRAETGTTKPGRPAVARHSTLEPPDPDQAGRDGRRRHRQIRDAMLLNRGAQIPNYDAVRTERYLYASYATGEHELYDLRHDPDEIHNVAGTRPGLEREFARRVAVLRRCGGRACRRLEDQPLRPPSAASLAATMRSLR